MCGAKLGKYITESGRGDEQGGVISHADDPGTLCDMISQGKEYEEERSVNFAR